jgi:Nucleoside 2-deoxyribosyltransferase like
MKVITSPQTIEEFECPAVFLGGAITGAPDWQQQAIELLQPAFSTVFNPRRATPFKEPHEPGYLEDYHFQVEWEHRYLLASDLVLFWMPKEAAALTTRFEIGWFFGMNFATSQKRSFLVGVEPGTKAGQYYPVALPKYGVTVYESLEEMCRAACDLFANS